MPMSDHDHWETATPRRRAWHRVVIAGVVVGALVLFAWPATERWFKPAPAPREVTARGDLAADEQNTIAIFESVSPSVVNITTTARVRDFWTRRVNEVPRGTGSGFVWDDQGHVVTNWHVVAGASRALVGLDSGRTFEAVLVGASPAHDLAVLKINVPIDAPPPVPVGSSADLKVGQKVFAIGNPFGLDHTLTTGVISALDRTIPGENGPDIEGLVQTDAAINPGNSGGALVDADGNLVGINTLIFSRSGGYQGIGFAIPVATARKVMEEIIETGTVTRGYLGVEIANITADLADSLGLRSLRGAIIGSVAASSPAERAGLRPGDVLVQVDGKSVADMSSALAAISGLPPGKAVAVRVQRGGRELTLAVTVGRRRASSPG